MTSRPATPSFVLPVSSERIEEIRNEFSERASAQPETPEVDALLLDINEGRVYDENGPLAYLARSLERRLAQAQARVAELEKDAARYRWLISQHNDLHIERWIATQRGSGTWSVIRGAAITKIIDAELKDKA